MARTMPWCCDRRRAKIVASTVALLSLSVSSAAAQQFALSSADLADSAALATSARRLAGEVLASYHEPDRSRYLDNVFRLQILLGRFAEASTSLAQLRALRQDSTPSDRARYVQYEILADAMSRGAGEGALGDRFARAFRDRFAQLDDATAAFAARAILLTPRTVAGDLRWATPDQSGRTTVSLEDALVLLRVYAAVESYRAFSGLPPALVAEEEARRYLVEKHIPVRTPDDATVCAYVVRPRTAREPLPALLQFTIYADSVTAVRDALLSAAHGYAGVTGHTRGKACSNDRPVPYVHDGADAAALIDWIARQPWSDGQVGMYGGSYSGFTAWAAAKRRPSALKGIMVGAPAAPGIDVPMEGNIFQNFIYQWTFYTTNNRWLDNPTYNDNARWGRLNRTWYTSGRPYRELEQIDGTPNPVFAEWLAHPTIDAYWRNMVPHGSEFAGIDIPVLQTAGYFFGGPGGAVWYANEHYRHHPGARHYLVIGPYDHLQAQRGVVTTLGDTATFIAGYTTDPVAGIDIVASLRYQWFDHVLRGSPRPALLQDRVNYQVMGANRWNHASSLATVANDRLRLYLHPGAGGSHTLTSAPPAATAAVTHSVNLADRSDADAAFVGGLLATEIDTANAVVLVSEPLTAATEVSGLLTGHLELIANRRDFDFGITLYEWMADGQYVQLPPFVTRASHARSVYERRLLTPGVRERLDFVSQVRMLSRQMSPGSRIVMVLSVPKSSRQQINYGTGRDVSDESIADAREPLVIRWMGGSYIDLPVRR
ncbi:MAG TPA: CocE/NonD family hydrolase [Longimicrobium sp.]|nr:CocE/NonD family hydrolase [Longimicrobium sp.]